MDVGTAIRTRRTVKDSGGPALTQQELLDLFELARWAPNHRLTEPWRFRAVGPQALAALEELSGEGAAKLRRAPTLVVASYVASPLPLHAEEDAHAAAAATYAVLLGAHARGLDAYWRTPAVLRTPAGRAAVALPDGERVVGLLYLGRRLGELPQAPARRGVGGYLTFLD